MGLEIFWTESAEYELHKIVKHYHEKAGYRVAKKLADGIHDEPSKLTIHPEQGFRYLVYKKNF